MKKIKEDISGYMIKNGITDMIAYVESLRDYEKFIEENYPQIHEEAWACVMSEEEE